LEQTIAPSFTSCATIAARRRRVGRRDVRIGSPINSAVGT
jgi:hypothetical protein